jgi:hypothetical protein
MQNAKRDDAGAKTQSGTMLRLQQGQCNMKKYVRGFMPPLPRRCRRLHFLEGPRAFHSLDEGGDSYKGCSGS